MALISLMQHCACCIWISHRQHRCCIPKIGVIGVRNKLRQQPMYSWPGTDASTGFIGCAMLAQRIKSVEVCNLGSSVVAGLVPATNPWYGIFPTHQRD